VATSDRLRGISGEAAKRARSTANDLRDRSGQRRSVLLVPPARGREIDPYSVGVVRSDLAAAHSSGAPYVRRDVDALLDQRIDDGWHGRSTSLVVVSGPHTSGKSRTLWEALNRVVPNATFYAVQPPRQSAISDPAARPVAELLRQGRLSSRNGTVIWIDDAHDHLDHGLDAGTLRELCDIGKGRGRRSTPVIVALTLDARRLADVAAFDPTLEEELRAALTGTALQPILNQRDELAEAKRLYPHLADHASLDRLPELFAGADLVRNRYRDGRSARPDGYAVARAAIAWRRAGMPPGIDRFDLHELTSALFH
jgi:cellulose synthase operon protein C